MSWVGGCTYAKDLPKPFNAAIFLWDPNDQDQKPYEIQKRHYIGEPYITPITPLKVSFLKPSCSQEACAGLG